jgi:hypothetical protein
MHTVTIATFNDPKPAERLREWLEAAGVPTLVRDQRLLQKIWFLARPYSSFHLDVEKDHYTKANALLSDWQQEKHALADALCCPKCGSLRLEYPHMTRQFILPTLVAHFLALIGVAKHQFYCRECQHTWRWPSKTGGQPVNAPH